MPEQVSKNWIVKFWLDTPNESLETTEITKNVILDSGVFLGGLSLMLKSVFFWKKRKIVEKIEKCYTSNRW